MSAENIPNRLRDIAKRNRGAIVSGVLISTGVHFDAWPITAFGVFEGVATIPREELMETLFKTNEKISDFVSEKLKKAKKEF